MGYKRTTFNTLHQLVAKYRVNKMVVDKVHLRHCIWYEFQKGSNASVACKNLCDALGSEVVNVRTCQRWFAKFHSGDFSLKEDRRFGQPSKVDNDILRSMLESNPHLTTRAIAKQLGIHHSTAEEHIKHLGFVLRQSIWVPHNLTERNLSDRVRICSSLLIRHNVEPFLDKLITGDEKWILYENIKRKKVYCKPGTSATIIAKPDLHQRKVMLCLWWDRRGPVYYELLKQGQTINANTYCNQLDKLNAAIKEKRPVLANRKGILFHQDNAKRHTAMATQLKLNELGWEVLSHPPYSPDIAPSYYYLFRSLQNYLTGKKFTSFKAVSMAVAEYFGSKDENFYARGIDKLPERWQRVVANNGYYIID